MDRSTMTNLRMDFMVSVGCSRCVDLEEGRLIEETECSGCNASVNRKSD
jgi:hypothetical protein